MSHHWSEHLDFYILQTVQYMLSFGHLIDFVLLTKCACLVCAQHGRLKVKTTEEQQKAKQEERAKKLKLYNAATSRAFQKVADKYGIFFFS